MRPNLSEEEYELLIKFRKGNLRLKPAQRNVLVIGDLHEPFCLDEYLAFNVGLYRKYQCSQVVFIGDIIDNHFSSYHETDPDGMSAGVELDFAINRLKRWYEAFPDAIITIGNHDRLIHRKAQTGGVARRWIRPYNEVLEVYNWKFVESWEQDNVLYVHGEGGTARNRIKQELQSTVQGHLHTQAYVDWIVGAKYRVFGMQVGCVDADTEYLTPTGWRRIADYKEGLVGQYNEDGTVSFVAPSEYIKAPCKELNKISTKYGVSQVICNEHDVVYKSRTGGLNKLKAAEVIERHHKNTGGFDGKFIVAFDISNNTRMPLTDDELRIMVAVHADGSIRRDCVSKPCRITIKKQRKKERIVSLLEKAGIEYTVHHNKNDASRYCFASPLLTKNYGPEWYQCSSEQLRVIADECVYWDGNQKNTFYTIHKNDADFIQYCFIATRRRAYISYDKREGKQSYRVIATNTIYNSIQSAQGKNLFQKVPTIDGFKYCFNVPSHMLVLRNNRCVFVTGNCGIDRKSYAAAYAKAGKKPAIASGLVLENGRLPIVEMMEL